MTTYTANAQRKTYNALCEAFDLPLDDSVEFTDTQQEKFNFNIGWTGDNHPRLGTTHSEESKALMRAAAKRRPKISQETSQRLSESRVGEKNSFYGKTHSDHVKKKISERHKGIRLSKERVDAMIASRTGIKRGPYKQVECPHCGKVGAESNMRRYHFDNCKLAEVASAITQ